MVWTRKAKIDFYWNRRRKAVETYVNAAKLLGTSTKRARKKAILETSKAYKVRKENFYNINRMEKQIKKLNNVTRDKKQEKQLQQIIKKQAKLISKTTEKWTIFEQKINYQTKGAQDEETITKAKT